MQGPSWSNWTGTSTCTTSCGGIKTEKSSCVYQGIQSNLCKGKLTHNSVSNQNAKRFHICSRGNYHGKD